MAAWRRNRSGFKNGPGFPNEQFVQEVLEWQFEHLGFHDDLSSNEDLDLAALRDCDQECWRIEAKGDTRENRTNDFHTCLGQLLRKMRDPAHKHGVALPDIPQYRTCVGHLAAFARTALNLHWLIVHQDESMIIEAPDGSKRHCAPPPKSVTTPKPPAPVP
jgi:hypothetical protein